MANPGDFAYTVKQQADIVRVIGEYVKLRKSGAQNYSGLCPFHGEKTASFSVHATRQFFHCFGCGLSGDVFSFVQKIENITFPEALRAVAQKFGIAVPQVSFSSPAEAKEAKTRTALLEIQERACVFFQECLKRPEGSRAREYLAGRGLDEATIREFRIGFAPDSGFLLKDRLRGEFSEEVLRESGLFSWKQPEESRGPSTRSPKSVSVAQDDNGRVKANSVAQDQKENLDAEAVEERSRSLDSASSSASGETGVARDDSGGKGDAKLEASSQKPEAAPQAMYSKFRNRVMFPIASEGGRVIAFTGRTLSSDEKAGPKYLNSPETGIYSKSKVLFNLSQAKEAIRKLDYAILVEGQMDCISVFAAGFHNVIASSGTAFTELQAKLLGRFSKNVVVNFDPDTAGAKATERTLGLLTEEDFQIKVLTLETGFDPDLYVRRKGKDAYAESLRNSQRYFDYLIERARAQFPLRNAEGKVKAVNYLLPHIQRVPSRIVRDELSQEIAQKLGIDSAVLRQELKHAATKRSATALKARPENQATDAEKIMIRALASATEMMSSPDQERTSSREGADEEFDPARQAQFALHSERLHEGLATESLIEALLNSPPDSSNILELQMPDSDRNLLAAILMKDDEDLTAERVEGAVRALRRIQLKHKLEQIQSELQALRSQEPERMQALLAEKIRLKMALRSPGMSDVA
jgi:DNA primase